MSRIINLPTITDNRGSLTVIEKILPFKIRRVYYIYNVPKSCKRGEHRHKLTIQALICLNGQCSVYVNNGEHETTVVLDSPTKCLILEPEDWHYMSNFTPGTVVLVLSSEYYNKGDYITEPYQ